MKSIKNKFYFGDPCYVLDETLYDAWCKINIENSNGLIKIDGKEIMEVYDTMYGDGCYDGLGVDSGTLAIIPVEFCTEVPENELKKNGRIIEATELKLTRDKKGCFRVYKKKDNDMWSVVDIVNTGYDD